MPAHPARLALCLAFASVACAGAPGGSTGPSRTAVASSSAAPAPSARAPRPTPTGATFGIHLPGADPNRFASIDAELRGSSGTLVGCVSTAVGRCRATQQVVLTAADLARYTELWRAIDAMPRCEPLARFATDRIFTITAGEVTYEDPLPADPAAVDARTADECAAPGRLAAWVARRFGALP